MGLSLGTRRAVTATLATAALSVPLALPSSASASTSLSYQLYKLRMCESGNNYRINTGNGYYGAYQFAWSTWHNLGYHGRPDRAPKSTQDAAARKLHHMDGWRPWPGCAQREHLH